jgi:SAM-dependent methyltransferase
VSGEPEPPDLGFDATVPNMARIYNYWLGGKDNFAADREAGDIALRNDPRSAYSVLANRGFLARTVRFLGENAGIRQFLDIGTGLPVENNTHEVAQAVAKESRVVYVDNDPMVIAHARALLRSSPEGRCSYIGADARDPGEILKAAAQTLDFTQPVALMLVAVMHCVPDDDDPYGVVQALLSAVPPGSYLVLSHPASDLNVEVRREINRQMNAMMRTAVTLRTRYQVTRFFDGLDLLDPGVVLVSHWRPENEKEQQTPTSVWGGVGLKR